MKLHPSLNRIRIFLTAGLLALSGLSANSACQVRSITPVSFGTYNVFTATDDTAVGSFTVGRCNFTAPYTATFSAGSSGNINARTMVNGPNLLQYNIYKDLAHTIILGGIGGQGVSVTGTGVTWSTGTMVSVYGLIPARQDVATSATPYVDTVVITITF